MSVKPNKKTKKRQNSKQERTGIVETEDLEGFLGVQFTPEQQSRLAIAARLAKALADEERTNAQASLEQGISEGVDEMRSRVREAADSLARGIKQMAAGETEKEAIDFKKSYTPMEPCDGCGCAIDHHLSYHLGTYAEEVEQNRTSYYCASCFEWKALDYLFSLASRGDAKE